MTPRVGITVKTVALIVFVAALPLVIGLLVGLPRYGRAARDAEERRQLAVVARVSAATRAELAALLVEARGMASSLDAASGFDNEEAANLLVSETLRRSEHLSGIRLTIPGVVDTVLVKTGIDGARMPSPTAEMLEEADRDGLSISVTDARNGLLTVPIPRREGQAGSRGYVTTDVRLVALDPVFDRTTSDLEWVGLDTGVAILDGDGRVLHARGEAPVEVQALPKRDTMVTVSEFDGPTRRMLGASEPLDQFGWTVVAWRPREDALSEFAKAERFGLLLALSAVAVALVLSLIAARTITRPLLTLHHQALRVGKRDWKNLVAPLTRGDELGDLSRDIERAATNLQESERALAKEARQRADLTRFMSPDVVEGILEGRHPMFLGGRRAEVTVLFADMVAFTKASQGLPPERVVDLLNELFTILTEVVFRHGGTVDKFLGDAIMAVWGAPLDNPDHADCALAAAEDMLRFADASRSSWKTRYGVDVRLAIAIDSGPVVVGNLGSERRMEYTAIGDAVNVAARLEMLASPNQVLIGARAAELLGDRDDVKLLGERTLAGRSQPMRVYELAVV